MVLKHGDWKKLAVAQRIVERAMLNIAYLEKGTDEILRSQTIGFNVVENSENKVAHGQAMSLKLKQGSGQRRSLSGYKFI